MYLQEYKSPLPLRAKGQTKLLNGLSNFAFKSSKNAFPNYNNPFDYFRNASLIYSKPCGHLMNCFRKKKKCLLPFYFCLSLYKKSGLHLE